MAEEPLPVRLEDCIVWAEWIGKSDRSLSAHENIPLVIARYLKGILQLRETVAQVEKLVPSSIERDEIPEFLLKGGR